LVPAGETVVDLFRLCGPPVPPPVPGALVGVLGPVLKLWVVTASLAVLPVMSCWVKVVRLPVLS
jgi:hypothetical protein